MAAEDPLVLHVYRADDLHNQAVPAADLHIGDRIPPDDPGPRELHPEWIARRTRFYEEQAAIVLRALECLPGGTRRQLLILLLRAEENVRRVP